MRQSLYTAFLVLAFVGGGLVGCHKPALRDKPLPDPLLTSKKPVEGRSYPVEAPAEHREELPPPPPPPPSPLASPSAPSPVAHLLRTPATP